MLGIRTPVKASENADKSRSSPRGGEISGPSPKGKEPRPGSVRKSIGEWESEAKESDTGRQGSPRKAVLTARPKRVVLSQQPKVSTSATTSRTSLECTGGNASADVPVLVDRVAEARACLNKAKLHLSNSRNLKAEIKSEVTQCIDRLYQLVKEAEGVKRTTKGKKGNEESRESGAAEVDNTKDMSLLRKLEEHGRLLEENKKEMERLRESLRESDTVRTYANVAANKTPPKTGTAHAVAITSADDNETGEQVLERVRTAINAKQEGVRVDRVRKAKDRKIIIGCNTREDIDKIKDIIGKSDGLKIDDIKNKDPLVVLRDVMQYNSDDDVLGAIRKQNGHIFQDISEVDTRMEVRYRRRARNPLMTHIVLKVSPPIWKKLTDIGVVHVDLQRVRVLDQSPLIQCSRCLGYGHTKRLCTEITDACSHCGGSHLRANCEEWLAGAIPSCRNCVRAKMDRRDHNAFSTDCPVRRKWESLARSAVAYC